MAKCLRNKASVEGLVKFNLEGFFRALICSFTISFMLFPSILVASSLVVLLKSVLISGVIFTPPVGSFSKVMCPSKPVM